MRPEHKLALERMLTKPVQVRYVHREDLGDLWRRERPREPEPEPYAFRAWTDRSGRVTMIVDPTETYDSALWLLVHELAHADLGTSRLLVRGLREFRTRHPRYHEDDDAHEDDIEERVANEVADRVMIHLGKPTGLSRRWWRQRVEER